MTKITNSIYASIIWLVFWIIVSVGASLFLFLIDQLRFMDEDLINILFREVLVPGGAAFFGLKFAKSAFSSSFIYFILMLCCGYVYLLWELNLLNWILPAREGLFLWSLASTFLGLIASLISIINLQKENKGEHDLDYLNS